MSEEFERKPLTVTQAMSRAKTALESCTVTLIGEVSEVSNKPGYKAVYFTVKDTGASLPCMMWMNRYHAAGVDLRVGALVQLTGRFTLYAAKGRMNFDVFSLALAGEGDLRQRVADLARKLQREGLMDAARKRPLPQMPRAIGVVTSPRGAAVHDVLRTLRRRFPLACILLAGVPVEGANAPAALIEGLRTVERAGADEILLVRGGGSFEDLMPFNDELLARAIAASRIPVITGIGHEPDTSIADMVADMRASTPTAAAEASAPDIHELAATLDMTNDRMLSALQQSLERRNLQFQRFAERPVFKDPHSLFAADAERLEVMGKRIHQAIPAGLARDTMALSALAKRLSTKGASLVEPYDAAMRLRASRLNDLSPLSVLGRGFAMVKDEEGTILRSVDAAPAGTLVDVALSDGTLSCRVEMSEHTEMVRINWEEPSCRK